MRKLFCALLLLLPSFSAAQSLQLDQETYPTEDPPLPHLLAFVACTIRTWSRRTLRLMACQSRAYHSAASRETAPTACAVVICFASYTDLPSSLV
jgi:hypothetical protein